MKVLLGALLALTLLAAPAQASSIVLVDDGHHVTARGAIRPDDRFRVGTLRPRRRRPPGPRGGGAPPRRPFRGRQRDQAVPRRGGPPTRGRGPTLARGHRRPLRPGRARGPAPRAAQSHERPVRPRRR